MNGKGSKPRQGANLELYWQNYDQIFKKKKINIDEIKEEIDKEPDISYSELQKILEKK